MNTSRTPTNGNNSVRRWFRRGHRWVGLSLVVFVLFLSVSGIALNHSGDLHLGGRHVSWSWLLDAYGLEVPAPSASFSDSGHRATLLGGHLFLDGRDTGQRDSTLVGIASLGPLVLIGAAHTAYLFTAEGEFVEAIDLGSESVGEIDRVGRTGDRAVVRGAGGLYVSDQDIAQFEPQTDMQSNIGPRLRHQTPARWQFLRPPGAVKA